MKNFIMNTALIIVAAIPVLSHAMTAPLAVEKIFDKVEANENWKSAFATGKEAQVVFMNVSPATNPSNEIGIETHKFDQIIFVVEGHGNAILNGKTTPVHKGDMIFIPMGTSHNVVNLEKTRPLKILSIYSGTDIPADAQFKTKADEPKG